jgi:uncharacterized protein YbjT (DUF2867 family)
MGGNPNGTGMRTALLAGTTGLVGSQLLQSLLEDNYYTKIKALSRTPLTLKHGRLENIVLDFDNLTEYKDRLRVDDIFCCLGTTMNKAGTKSAFRKVDYEYPLTLGEICKTLGAKQYLLISALGANKESRIYYNHIKGEIEAAITGLGFETVHILRPSLLLGDRVEKRSAEDAAKMMYKVISFLLPQKLRAIDSGKVAHAMKYYAKQEKKGVFIHESKELQTIA